MAIVVGKVNAPTYSWVNGDRIEMLVDVAGDSSYPTGGTPITPAMFGLSEIHFFDPGQESTGVDLAAYDYANNKLKCFTALGTEVTNTTSLAAKTFRCHLIGKGSAKVIG